MDDKEISKTFIEWVNSMGFSVSVEHTCTTAYLSDGSVMKHANPYIATLLVKATVKQGVEALTRSEHSISEDWAVANLARAVSEGWILNPSSQGPKWISIPNFAE